MKHLFFPLATTTTLLLLLLSAPTTANAASPVYDVMGEPLLSTKTYYMVPYDYSDVGGGGLTWKTKGGNSCPIHYVVQEDVNTRFGVEIGFINQNPAQTPIFDSTQLNIVCSTFPDVCPGWSKVWSVAPDPATGIQYIDLTGGKARPGVTTLFSIEEVEEGGYKIRYCHPNASAECGDLGIVSNAVGRWLGVNGTHPLTFVFETWPYIPKNARRSVPAYKLGSGTSYLAQVLSLFN